MKDKILILEIINSLGSGGAESLLKNFVLEARKNKLFKIEIATLYSNAIFKEEIKNAAIPIYDLDLKYKYDLRGILKIITLIKKRKYDIIHVHLFPSNLFAALSSLFLSSDIKWVFSEHNIYNRRRSLKIFRILDIFIYSRYGKVICVSEQVKCALIKWLPHLKKKIIVIPNCVSLSDLSGFHLFEKYDYDILFVGRLTKAKGVDILLKAVRILKDKYRKKVKVAIAGDGSLKENLHNMAMELGINEEVKFLGVRKDIGKLMESSSIFVLPSRWEGLPMVILEAMSKGMSIIATKVGGIPEVIKNGKEGILISPEDPKALAQTINDLLENEELREKLSQAAYKKVRENYSIEAYSANMLDFYGSLVNN